MKKSTQMEIELYISTRISKRKALESALEKAALVFTSYVRKGLLPKKSFPQIRVAVDICSQKKIALLNEKYRNLPRPTDVLSFPLHDKLVPPTPFLHLGDIFICYEIAKKQADEYNVLLIHEILRLFFHGALHLCGIDHESSKKEARIMEGIEVKLINAVLQKFKKTS